MTPSLCLRAWRSDDAETTLALFRDTVRAVNSRDYDAAQIAAWASEDIALDDWRRRLEAQTAWVAERAGTPVGFASLTPQGVVDLLFVAKDRQGEGIASALLDALEAAARANRIPLLTTNASITARPFFAARGFALDAEQEVELRGQSFRNFRMSKRIS